MAGTMRRQSHIVECQIKSLEPLLNKVHKHSYFPASKKRSFLADGSVSSWTYDLRLPLSKNEFLKPVCLHMLKILEERGIRQIAGKGYGSFFLIGGIVANGENFRAGLLRESRKKYGFRNRLEGDLVRNLPVYIVDDILSTGKTVSNIANTLLREGYRPAGVITVFRFGWENAEGEIKKYNLEIECLATLRNKYG